MKIKFLDCIIRTIFQNKGNSSTIALYAVTLTMTLDDLEFQDLLVLQILLLSLWGQMFSVQWLEG